MERRHSFAQIPYHNAFLVGNLTPPSAGDLFPSSSLPYYPGHPTQDCPPFESEHSNLLLTRPLGFPPVQFNPNVPLAFPNPDDFPVAMADDFLPFPLSPSGPPLMDTEEPLLTDIEQKFFTEFLDTLVDPVDPIIPPHPLPTYQQPVPHVPAVPPNYPTQQAGTSSQFFSNHDGQTTNRLVQHPSAPPEPFQPSKEEQDPEMQVETPVRAPRSAQGGSAPSHATLQAPSLTLPIIPQPPSRPSTPVPPTSAQPANPPPQQLPSSTSAKSSPASVAKPKPPRLRTPPKRRSGRDLLTDDQKRTNHIISEQRRRNLIRSGFKALADMVPGLKGGNLGSSKSAILYNTVGYIRHLEGGNRALTEQLGMLQRRYEIMVNSGAIRNTGRSAGLQPPPAPQYVQPLAMGRSASAEEVAFEEQSAEYDTEPNGVQQGQQPPPPSQPK